MTLLEKEIGEIEVNYGNGIIFANIFILFLDWYVIY